MGIGEIVILAIVVFVLGILLGITTSCLCMAASLGFSRRKYTHRCKNRRK